MKTQGPTPSYCFIKRDIPLKMANWQKTTSAYLRVLVPCRTCLLLLPILPFRPACSSSTAVYRSVLYLSPASLLFLPFLHFSPSALRQLPATMQFCLLVFYCRLSTVLLAHILPLLAVTRSVLPVPLLVLPVYLTNLPVPLLFLPVYLTILSAPFLCCLSTSQISLLLFLVLTVYLTNLSVPLLMLPVYLIDLSD